MVISAFVFAPVALAALALSSQGVKGNRLYRAGEMDAAIRAYEAALAKRPDDATVRYNLGTALLRAGRTGEAGSHLTGALGTRAPELRSRAFYNLGNVGLEAALAGDAKAAQRAVESYRQALLIRPDDHDAKWNLELALRELQRLRLPNEEGAGGEDSRESAREGEPPPPPRTPEPGERPSGGESTPQARTRQPRDVRPLSREAAEQILNAAEEQERALQREKARRTRPSGRPAGPDW